MLNKKKHPEKILPSGGSPLPDSAALDSPQSALRGVTPPDAPAKLPSPAPAVSKPAEKQPGPGRPATRPHCLRCSKRLERCKCKDGSLLTAKVVRAVDEARKRETLPLSKDEAEQILRFLCWGFGIAESAAAAMMTNLTWDEAEGVYSFSEEDVAALLPPAHKVLAKYAARLPSWIRDYRDEMALAMALYGVEKRKASAAAAILQSKTAKLPAPRPQIVPAAPLPKPLAPMPSAPETQAQSMGAPS